MKRFILLGFLWGVSLLYSNILFAQTCADTIRSVGSGNWANAATWSPAGRPSCGVLIIQAGHRVTISTQATFNGDVLIYGTLVFFKDGSAKGQLTMNDTSTVQIHPSGNIDAAGNGIASTFLQIGSQTIKGNEIDLLQEPNQITQESIAAGGGCAETGVCDPDPLPVDLLYFKAAAIENGIAVEWASAREWAFSHYTIERSLDGNNFEAIHTEYVEGESNSTKAYRFVDAQPQYGANYYRLLATDLDGTVEDKGTIVAYVGASGKLEISPNPAFGGSVTIAYAGAMPGTWLSLRNANGQEVMKIEMPEDGLRLPISALPSGLYIVRVWNQLEVKQAKLIIP